MAEYLEIKNTSKETRTVRRQFVEHLKGSSPCADCKNKFPPYAMQFDHIGNDKLGNVTDIARTGSMEELIREMMKCEIVCAICHCRRSWMKSKGLDITYQV